MKQSPEAHGVQVAIDWTIALINVLAGALCISAAVGNYITYNVSLRIVALMIIFITFGTAFILLELLALVQPTYAVRAQTIAPHMSAYIGRATTYFLLACLTSDSRIVNRANYKDYAWLWANASALAAIAIAFFVIGIVSFFVNVPKPKSMDSEQRQASDHFTLPFASTKKQRQRQASGQSINRLDDDEEDAESDGYRAEDYTAQIMHRGESIATLDGLSISSMANVMNRASGMYVGPASSDHHSGTRHGHGRTWRNSALPPSPDHRRLSYTLSKLSPHQQQHQFDAVDEQGSFVTLPLAGNVHHADVFDDDQDENKKEQLSDVQTLMKGQHQDKQFDDQPYRKSRTFVKDAKRRLSNTLSATSSSSSPPSRLQDIPKYEKTTERLAGNSSRAGFTAASPPHNADFIAGQQRSPRSYAELPPLQTGDVKRGPTYRRRVYIPSISAAVELSSGESSPEDEDEIEEAKHVAGKEEEEEEDDRSVYSLPSGISPEQTYDVANAHRYPVATTLEGTSSSGGGGGETMLGRRLTRRETRLMRNKIQRGLVRAASVASSSR